GRPGELLSRELPVLGFPVVEEFGQRLGSQPGGGRLGEPARKTPAAASCGGAHRVTEIRIERHAQLVHLHKASYHGRTYQSRTYPSRTYHGTNPSTNAAG